MCAFVGFWVDRNPSSIHKKYSHFELKCRPLMKFTPWTQSPHVPPISSLVNDVKHSLKHVQSHHVVLLPCWSFSNLYYTYYGFEKLWHNNLRFSSLTPQDTPHIASSFRKLFGAIRFRIGGKLIDTRDLAHRHPPRTSPAWITLKSKSRCYFILRLTSSGNLFILFYFFWPQTY